MKKLSSEEKVAVLDVLLEAMAGSHDGAGLSKRQVQAARTRLDKDAAAERLAPKKEGKGKDAPQEEKA